ncbi:MAG: response regulator [Actinomycetes bacterium]
MAVRVLLADDNADFLGAVADSLAMCDGVDVVATAPDGDTALRLAMATSPDVAVIDVEMSAGGAALAARLLAQRPGLRVLCLSGRDDEQTVLAMLSAGATGYLVKGSLEEDLGDCIRRCAAGVLFVAAGCADAVRARIAAALTLRH